VIGIRNPKGASVFVHLALIHHAVLLAAAASSGSIPGMSGITSLTNDMKTAGIALCSLAIMAGGGLYAFSSHEGKYGGGRGHSIVMKAAIGAGLLGVASLIPSFLAGLG
jgi:hypothetical protein